MDAGEVAAALGQQQQLDPPDQWGQAWAAMTKRRKTA
jgi:hypothetical protein